MFYGNKSRAKNGTETTQIELAEKILDRDGLSFLDEILRQLIGEWHPRADQEHIVS